MALNCDCDDALESPKNSKCDTPDYGNQVVKVFIQKMTGTDFDGTADNTITVEADWEAKINDDDDDRIVIIANISNGVVPESEPNVEEGNAVAYGGKDVIDQPRMITGEAKFLSQTDFALWDKVLCWPLVRVWFLTNKNWVFGYTVATGAGIPNATVIKKSYVLAGIGTKNRIPFELSWNDLCEAKPIAQLDFLATLEGSNLSGSAV